MPLTKNTIKCDFFKIHLLLWVKIRVYWTQIGLQQVSEIRNSQLFCLLSRRLVQKLLIFNFFFFFSSFISKLKKEKILAELKWHAWSVWLVTHGPPIFKLKLSSVHAHKFQSLIQLKWNESNNLQPEMFYLCFLLTNTNVRIAKILCSLEVACISK